jgi:hypothetical protein
MIKGNGPPKANLQPYGRLVLGVLLNIFRKCGPVVYFGECTLVHAMWRGFFMPTPTSSFYYRANMAEIQVFFEKYYEKP